MPLQERDYYRDKFKGESNPRRSSSGCLTVLVVIAVIVFGIVVVSQLNNPSPPTSPTPAPAPPPAPSPQPEVSEPKVILTEDIEKTIFSTINSLRASEGTNALLWSSYWHEEAKNHSEYMARAKAYKRPRLSDFENVFYCVAYSAENVAKYALRSWTEVEKYSDNLLTSNATYVGIGVAKRDNYYYVTFIASRASSQEDPTPTDPPQTVTQPSPVSLPPEIVEQPLKQTSSGSSEVISREYKWTYKGSEWTWEGNILLSLYEYYQELPRPPTQNYSVYVTHPLDDIYVEHLVEKIQKAAREAGFSEYETIEFAASFVQSLPYTADSITTPYDEYPRYPIETLVDKGGDCEDTSILLASIIEKMGYGVVLIELPNHCAVGVKGGENAYGTYWEYGGSKYYYIETTGEGWGIGQLPEEYENTSADIYPMIPTPILTHDWNIEGKGNVGELEVTVYNVGTATAYNVSVLAGFDAGENKLWNAEQSDYFQIRPDHQVTVTLDLRVPLDKHTRVIVQIGIDDVLADESHSDWFDTTRR